MNYQRRISNSNLPNMESVLILKYLILISTLSVLLLSTVVGGSSYDLKFIPWGEKCRIPKADEFLLPHEDCDESKGIICQKYSQGEYCGCRISSMLSYDRLSGECRRMPHHHCIFVNTTVNPDVLKNLPYNVKCHTNADCVIRQPHPDKKKKDDKALELCQCKRGFVVSRDNLECVNVNFAGALLSPSKPTVTIMCFISLALYSLSTSFSHFTTSGGGC